MSQFSNVDLAEIQKFDSVARWWDLRGEMRTLHVINPLRVQFILEKVEQTAPRVLDVGCGGGILSEALTRAGAWVTGIDLSQQAIEVARQHAQEQGLNIEYLYQSAEGLAEERPEAFDVVTCLEMLEHVPQPQSVVRACARAVKPGGHLIFSTINRTPKAFLFVIIGGEYILRLLRPGTHDYRKFIRPVELRKWAEDSGLRFLRIASLLYNPFTRRFRLVEGIEDNNYFMHFIKS